LTGADIPAPVVVLASSSGIHGMRSRPDRYGSVAVTIHWLSALAILALIGSGFGAATTTDAAAKLGLLQLHVPLALIVLVLTLARITWWWLADRKPEPIAGSPKWQEASARGVHLLLYGALFLLFGSGIAMMAMSGAGNVLFTGAGVLPDFARLPPHTAHLLGALLLIALLVAHVGAALYHQLGRRDNIFRRIWYGRSN
jgi:cytochrome b561